jgi:hypothetical protein
MPGGIELQKIKQISGGLTDPSGVAAGKNLLQFIEFLDQSEVLCIGVVISGAHGFVPDDHRILLSARWCVQKQENGSII